MIQYNNTPITTAAATVAYWIWKKNQQSSFPVTGYRIPFRTTNSHRHRILIARGGGRRTRTRAPRIGTAPRFWSSDYIYAPPPPSVQIARRSLASRKKCVFISTVTIFLFFLYHSLTLSLSLSLINSQHTI
jgi:hypothetical protein